MSIYLKKPSVIVPFMGFPERPRADQMARAQLIKDLLGATVLDYRTLTPGILARSLLEKLDRPAVKSHVAIPDDWFDGAPFTARRLMEGR
jgi:predicted glycosyltransferase